MAQMTESCYKVSKMGDNYKALQDLVLNYAADDTAPKTTRPGESGKPGKQAAAPWLPSLQGELRAEPLCLRLRGSC